MEFPVDITFHGVEVSRAVEERVLREARALETAYQRIIRVEVAVEAPHRSVAKGQRYHVRVNVEVPGKDVVISRDPGNDDAHEDVYVAIRDAFRAARRRLESHVAKNLRREVKERGGPAHGRVIYLDAERAWGRLESGDGREVYFHRNSVTGDIGQLEIGDEVRFEEAAGVEGPQASTVTPVGRNGRHEMPAP